MEEILSSGCREVLLMIKLDNSVIWKEQVYWILWERLPAAIVLIRGWKPLPQVSFLVTWTYRICALDKSKEALIKSVPSLNYSRKTLNTFH